nr:protein YLS7 [Ipomoea batatas]
MPLASAQGTPPTNYPKTLLSIVSLVGGLAVFLLLASSFLALQPDESSVRRNFYGVDSSKKVINGGIVADTTNRDGSDVGTSRNFNTDSRGVDQGNKDGEVGVFRNSDSSASQENESDGDVQQNNNGSNGDNKQPSEPQDTVVPDSEQGETAKSSHSTQGLSEGNVVQPQHSGVKQGNRYGNDSTLHKGKKDETLPSSDSNLDGVTSSSSTTMVEPQANSECNLYHGKWIFDSTGPLYTNNSCPVITQMQNCQGNGRPDKDYENWRWKPDQCDLPRFNPKKFLELMRGKTLAFIGDSVARNQMESLLCILWQFEVPKNRGNRRMQRYYFRSTSTMIVRIWSSWLVNQTSEPFGFAPAGVAKIHLDVPDDVFMGFIPQFDVVVLSSGHWFAKQSVYILNNEIVGGQLWWPKKSRRMKVNNIEAFGISVETILTALGRHPTYHGLTIVRAYSPDHYEGGAWNTGGSCTGKVKPVVESDLLENAFTNIMHQKQFTGYARSINKKNNKSALKFMDITRIFEYRHDGHPGPYRSPDPNKITKRGPDGRPPPQDCLHWCMPGPVDTWNEMVFELIRREFEDKQSTSS